MQMGQPVIPDWLRRHLERTGAIGRDGIARQARPRRCPRCGAVVLAGLDADLAALRAVVDPAPLSAQAELAALLAGRRTFRLANADGGRVEIDARDHFAISATPPGGNVIVVAAHECGKPLAEIPSANIPPVVPGEEGCPF